MTGAAMSLDGKRVIVIGGASGIGFAVAALAREIGAEVVIASRGAARVAAAVERLAARWARRSRVFRAEIRKNINDDTVTR